MMRAGGVKGIMHFRGGEDDNDDDDDALGGNNRSTWFANKQIDPFWDQHIVMFMIHSCTRRRRLPTAGQPHGHLRCGSVRRLIS